MTKVTVLWCVALLLLVCNVIVVVLLVRAGTAPLRVSFLDVGQGDAILIEGPTGRQVLIDAGKDRSVMRQLPRLMGPLDRSLDVVIETHPDADHIGGMPDVFKRYHVSGFLSSNVKSDTSFASAKAAAVLDEKDVIAIEARRGQRIHLGGGAYADILYPDRSVHELESNTGSVVMRIVYGNTSFLVTGDAPLSVEEWLVRLDGSTLQSSVLKAGHHGSRTSTSRTWIEHVSPDTVVISAGKDNSYGHPHDEVVAAITKSGAHMVSTAERGTVTFISNGTTVRLR